MLYFVLKPTINKSLLLFFSFASSVKTKQFKTPDSAAATQFTDYQQLLDEWRDVTD